MRLSRLLLAALLTFAGCLPAPVPADCRAAPESCDGVDNDCDGAIPVAELDLGDFDGWAPCEGDCAPGDRRSYPGAPEFCDGRDNDCDGEIPIEEKDSDGDGLPDCLQ